VERDVRELLAIGDLDAFAGLGYWLGLPGNVEQRGVLVFGGDDMPHRRQSHLVRPWFACS